ncbi:MAG: PilZ domain-containing protein [Nitrospinales bacterium]
MPLDRRGQRRFKLNTVVNAQFIGKDENPIGSTISGLLQDISIGGARFTTHHLEKDQSQNLLTEMATLTFPFENNPPISVSGQIVGTDYQESNGHTLRLKFHLGYINENLNKLIDICHRLKNPSESEAIQKKLEGDSQINAADNLSSLENLMDELSRMQNKLGNENPPSIANGGAVVSDKSNGSQTTSIKIIPEEKNKIDEPSSSSASSDPTPPEEIPQVSIEPDEPQIDLINEVAEVTIEPIEEQKKDVPKVSEPIKKTVKESIKEELPEVQILEESTSQPQPPKPIINIEETNPPNEVEIETADSEINAEIELEIEEELPTVQIQSEATSKPIEKKSEIKSRPLSPPDKTSETSKGQKSTEPKSEPIKSNPSASQPLQPRDQIFSLIREIKKDPKNMGLIQKLIDLYISEELFEDAIKALKAVIKVNPREAELQFLLGDTYFKTEEFKKCLTPLNLAIRLNSKHAKAHYIFSMANELAGNEEVGEKHYHIATTLDPDIENKV